LEKYQIFIGADHAGWEFKNKLIKKFPQLRWEDLGPDSEARVDYPDFADKVAEKIKSTNHVGVLICGSGQGMAMRANKHKHIRAALCWNEEVAQLSRAHNDANVLCLGSRVMDENTMFKVFETFLDTKFEGGRHADRVKKLSR
jgi:ribose 5-phosphate isomerase B